MCLRLYMHLIEAASKYSFRCLGLTAPSSFESSDWILCMSSRVTILSLFNFERRDKNGPTRMLLLSELSSFYDEGAYGAEEAFVVFSHPG
jgi:hypothetical protein